MRLIDADKLLEVLNKKSVPFNANINDAILTAPTVEERKKGKWVPKDDRRYHCSSCDGIAPKGYRWDFCPDCGADMRGEEEW